MEQISPVDISSGEEVTPCRMQSMAGLTLRLNDRNPIYIGGSIRVQVLKTASSYVRLQILAPDHVSIMRGNQMTQEQQNEMDAAIELAAVKSGS